MYFPYLRGRQYELLALRELVENDRLGDKIIPIIEPVKLSSTLMKTISTYHKAGKSIVVIVNPKVGTLKSELSNAKEGFCKNDFFSLICEQGVYKAHIMNSKSHRELIEIEEEQIFRNELVVIVDSRKYLDIYVEEFEGFSPRYVLMPDESVFRRKIRKNRVLLADKFEKQKKNSAYKDEAEVFSEDHLYFSGDGYIGFSDYSIVGSEYLEAGFAPYAVAIHIVYFSKDGVLKIRHFVSDSNDDIRDPAGKFYEAVKKLASWLKKNPIEMTLGLESLLACYSSKSYPGLGSVKKMSIMHHLELMNKYLMTGVAK